jgi:Tol biopolymer transport system component
VGNAGPQFEVEWNPALWLRDKKMIWFLFTLVIFQSVEGYISDPRISNYGIIVTDNKCSALYLLNGDNIEKLFSHAAGGRYYTVSPDKRYVGFKLIRKNGEQMPAIYDLETRSITHLNKPVFQAGQPSFSHDGKVAFTIGEDLVLKIGEEKEIYHLGTYANLCPVSPDGRFVAFNDDNDQLWIFDIEKDARYCFTDSKSGYYYPIWSPDSRLIVFSTLDGFLSVYDLLSKTTYQIGPGQSVNWSNDSKYLVFHKNITDNHVLLNSELYLAKYDGSEYFELTNSKDRLEIEPRFIDEDEIIFNTYRSGEIYGGKIVDNRLAHIKRIYRLSEPIELNYSYPKSDFGIRDSLNVPYIHQVYDTPDWHNGHWSCAPTTAMMAIAYYRKLPYWDSWCSSPHGHTSHFGNYICSIYHYREITYDLVAEDASGNSAWGGYGYMWYNNYSPYSRMMNYLQYHDLTSWSDDSPTWSETIAEIQAGWPYCMCVGLTAAGHLVLGVGQVLDWHTLIFNDPYGNKNTPGYPSYDGKYSRYDWPGYYNGYENLNQVHWCRGARGNWAPQCDTIVDDLQYQYTGESYGFYIFNNDPSSQRYFHDNLTGYNGHMWWTYTTTETDTCYVTWTPHLSQPGDYEVYAYIPDVNSNTNAHYQIHYNGGTQTVIIDQSNYSNQWVSLGIFPFALSNGYVYLGDATGIPGQRIGFDAIRWSPVNQVAEEKAMRGTDKIKLISTLVTKDAELFVSHPYQGQIKISIFDATGKLVFNSKSTLNRSNQRIIIKTSSLTSGVYFLKASLPEYVYIQKFIKLH